MGERPFSILGLWGEHLEKSGGWRVTASARKDLGCTSVV